MKAIRDRAARIRAIRDRADRLLMGPGAASRLRVARLLDPQAAADARAAFYAPEVAEKHPAKPAKTKQSARVKAIRERLRALTADDAPSSDLAA